MNGEEPTRWRAYVTKRGVTPCEVLGEIIRHWDDGSVPSHERLLRPNRPSEVDQRQDELRDEIVAACDRLEAKRQGRAA